MSVSSGRRLARRHLNQVSRLGQERANSAPIAHLGRRHLLAAVCLGVARRPASLPTRIQFRRPPGSRLAGDNSGEMCECDNRPADWLPAGSRRPRAQPSSLLAHRTSSIDCNFQRASEPAPPSQMEAPCLAPSLSGLPASSRACSLSIRDLFGQITIIQSPRAAKSKVANQEIVQFEVVG